MKFFILVFLFFFVCFAKPLGIDPAFLQGKLTNGISYFIRENKTPSNKTELWLQIGSGSLDEEEHQQGVAHFLEHLAFNGSQNFPSGSLVKYFESLGLKFGAHQNAFTSFKQTVYTLSLPKSDLETIGKGLLCLSDYAYRLTLDEEEIEKERDVILEEKRVRSGASRRFWRAYLKELLPNSRIAHRFPIGIEKGIKSFRQKDFKEFYQKWYRPANASVIVVGDFNSLDVKKLVEKYFLDWKKSTETLSLKSGIVPNNKRKISIISDEEFENTTVLLSNVFLKKPSHTTKYFDDELIEKIIHYIINLRFQKYFQKKKIAFKAGTYNFNFVKDVNIFSASANGEFKYWQDMLDSLISEIRLIQKFGFSIEEFMLSQTHYVALYKEAVKLEGTQTSDYFAKKLNDTLVNGRLPLSSTQELELVEQFFRNHLLKEINDYFSKHYNLNTANIVFKIPDNKRKNISEEKIKKVIEIALNKKIIFEQFKYTGKKLFNKKLKGGEITKLVKAKILPISSFGLKNNIIINHYYSEIKKNQVLVTVTIPAGSLSETNKNKGIHKSLLMAFNSPATKNLSSPELTYLSTGKSFSISAVNERDSVLITLVSSKDDLEIGMQTLYLLLTEAKIEEFEFKIWKERQYKKIAKQNYEIESRHWSEFSKIISYGDLRFTSIKKQELEQLSLIKAQAKLDALIQSPLEVSITGDIDLERAQKLSKLYFGSLSHRGRIDYNGQLRQLKRSYTEQEVIQNLKSKTEKSLILFAWRFQDYDNLKQRLSLELASHIISTKLNEEIREKKGLTYSISSSLIAHEMLPERGMFYITFSSDPTKSEKSLLLAREIVESFRKIPVSEEQLEVALKQSLHILDRQQKMFGYWSSWLSGMNYRQRDYDYPNLKANLLRQITVQDIQNTLQKILIPSNFISLITKSEEK